ncbi:excinuclease ABC subunit UvrA [Victivallis vadensis]|uniref:excinuclease ABC subunit UvrA n=1 Tax=Victivallis vadensis TaxID=172901 RepID=UPI00266CDB17|nr:excinuclease ABC subunit UvrA [Victivallis vadensis]
MFEKIQIRGATQHNLKGIDVTIPRNKLVVITGLSGSGKSSLAFDTLYAEGQRRYVESLSAYARQFLDRMQKPKVEHIEGLSPAIAIEQRTAGGTPRSTVATVTEIYDYLRLLYAHVGVPHCPHCGRKLQSQSAQAIAEQLLALKPGQKMMILAPFVNGRKGEHRDVLDSIRSEGFVRARIDGDIVQFDEEELPRLEKTRRHTIEAVVDRLITGKLDRSRLTDSVETALRHGGGTIHVLLEAPAGEKPDFEEEKFSENLACPDCGVSYGELLPRNFSFNSPYGACPECNGLGVQQVMDPLKVVPDPSLSIKNGAIPGWRRGPRHLIIYYNLLLRKLSEWLEEPDMLTTPFNKLPERVRNIVLYGTGDTPLEFDYRMHGKKYRWSKPFEGVLENLRRRMTETESDSVRERLGEYLSPRECPACHGARLKPVSLAVTVGGLGIDKFNAQSVEAALKFVSELELDKEQAAIAGDVLKEIRSRLTFLCDVGLNYLTLDRVSSTLSGGEAQRIRLATQLGCGLVGVLYILDEPSIGLHQRDNDRLLDTLEKLRDIGNTVLVVEHDLDTIERADYVLDLGPGAGVHGGELVAYGTPKELVNFPRSLTADFLAGRREIAVPDERQKGNGHKLVIRSAEFHNLRKLTAEIPLGTFTCVTGVSGSGKSSLINGILVRALNAHQGIQDLPPGKCKAVEGLEFVDKAIVIDQSPIGRTPRSNPATYTDAFGGIRKLFSELPESKVRGFGPGRFSFNVKGGRCEECKGDGIKKIEMQFLSDVYVECSACNGRRFNKETLGVHYKKKNIADVLDMTVNQAVEFFSAIPSLTRKFKTLQEVGLGYVTLGQPATTLSGGEAQRVKLAAELARVPRGHTVYILDEPTTGLHLADIDQLLKVLFKLRDMGNTVIVIEHNLDVIKTADYLLDLGPEGGDRGGKLIASGTPEEVAKVKGSHTGRYLKKYLKK